jgi:hypothetical protein
MLNKGIAGNQGAAKKGQLNKQLAIAQRTVSIDGLAV